MKSRISCCLNMSIAKNYNYNYDQNKKSELFYKACIIVNIIWTHQRPGPGLFQRPILYFWKMKCILTSFGSIDSWQDDDKKAYWRGRPLHDRPHVLLLLTQTFKSPFLHSCFSTRNFCHFYQNFFFFFLKFLDVDCHVQGTPCYFSPISMSSKGSIGYLNCCIF